MLSARFLLLPHRHLTAGHDQATKTSPYLVPPPSVLKYPTLSPAFPPPHLRFHGAFVQWIDVTQAPSEYFRRKAVVSDLGSVIASQLASPKSQDKLARSPVCVRKVERIESPPGAVRLI